MKKLLILCFWALALTTQAQNSTLNRIAEKQGTSFSVGLVIRNLPDSLRLLEAEFRTSTSRLKKFSTADGSIQRVSDTLYVFKFSNQDTRTYYGRGTWQVEIQTALTGARKTDVFNYEIYASITGAASTAPVNNSGYTYLFPLTFTTVSVSMGEVIANLPIINGESIANALFTKVDKVAGYSLSQNNYSNAAKAIVDAVTGNLATKLNITDTVPLLRKTTAAGVYVAKVAGQSLLLDAERTKLAGIATGATANSTDSQLRDRSTHTGAQAISTVTGLQTALNVKVAFVQVNTYADMLALGTPSVLTEITVLTDSNKSLNNTIYKWWPSGKRIWIAAVDDN
ncbi:hypothetical protein [Runella sp.]|uniref:hypothetical protein n=1 Tax=Runella sp. TaxID=1960881 RepID=UPI003D0D8484